MKKVITFRSDNEDLINWLASQNNTSEFIESTLDAVRSGQLQPLSQVSEAKELDTQIKKARLSNLNLDAKLKEKKLSYIGIFHSEPSDAAIKAMQTGIKQREFSEDEYENILKYITLKNENFKWIAKCDICKGGETYDTRRDAIIDMVRHLTTEHHKKVMEIQR